MKRLMTAIARVTREADGQDLLEYGLLAALIALVAIVGITTVGETIYNVFWSAIGQVI